MTQPPQIIGTIKLGEANATLPDLKARIGGGSWLYQFALVVMVAGAAIVGWEWHQLTGAVFCVAAADIAYNWIGARLLWSAYRRRWTEAGKKLNCR